MNEPTVLSKAISCPFFTTLVSHPCLLGPVSDALELRFSQTSPHLCCMPIVFLPFPRVQWGRSPPTFPKLSRAPWQAFSLSFKVPPSLKAVSVTHPLFWLMSSALPAMTAWTGSWRRVLGMRGRCRTLSVPTPPLGLPSSFIISLHSAQFSQPISRPVQFRVTYWTACSILPLSCFKPPPPPPCSWGFPRGSEGKESACNAGDPGSIPGSGRSTGKGNSNPLQYSCLEDPMDRGAWQATVHGVAYIYIFRNVCI